MRATCRQRSWSSKPWALTLSDLIMGFAKALLRAPLGVAGSAGEVLAGGGRALGLGLGRQLPVLLHPLVNLGVGVGDGADQEGVYANLAARLIGMLLYFGFAGCTGCCSGHSFARTSAYHTARLGTDAGTADAARSWRPGGALSTLFG